MKSRYHRKLGPVLFTVGLAVSQIATAHVNETGATDLLAIAHSMGHGFADPITDSHFVLIAVFLCIGTGLSALGLRLVRQVSVIWKKRAAKSIYRITIHMGAYTLFL